MGDAAAALMLPARMLLRAETTARSSAGNWMPPGGGVMADLTEGLCPFFGGFAETTSGYPKYACSAGVTEPSTLPSMLTLRISVPAAAPVAVSRRERLNAAEGGAESSRSNRAPAADPPLTRTAACGTPSEAS
jgi:hypothetical protein